MCWWKWVNGVVLVLDVRVHSRYLRVCVRVCVNVESEGKGKERNRKGKKDSLIKRARYGGDVCCCSLFFFFFWGEAGRAFSLKKIGAPARRVGSVPARERQSFLILPFDTTSCHGCLLVLFVSPTPPRVAAAETWRASQMNNDCTFHCCLSLHRRPCRPCRCSL